MTSLSLGHVKLKDAGNYKLTLENSHGSVSLDVRVKVIGKPSPPQNLKVKEVTQNSVKLTWSPPAEDGGSSIISYHVEKRDPKRKMYTQVGETESCEFKVTRLFEGNEYVFQVTAENDIGIGEPAELSQGITPQSPYESPLKLNVKNITRNNLDLSWSAPKNDGGSAISGYIVERRTTYSPRWSKVNRTPIKETELHLEDLMEGEEFEFRVLAVNEAGYGRPSDPTQPIQFIISDLYAKPIVLHVGEATVIEVPFRGSPQPRPTWRFEGMHITENRKKYSETIYNMTSLTLSRVALEDAGTYTLLLENNFGSSQMSVRVIVLGNY
ncbi:hypothetical protein CAPTEDRAFT_139799 [Capitella teleta]|uniref:Titin n=1 Tax=Capitella teleta TaxID=283909 RepID=R7TR19_CAPTE|nr:hypothetical protein CAPTEDRAFT_139799 [Capitella teleta]|eukprot:ELT96022.1 hypothetical protein CAPTEDRAFT_139799 [Capitella teleta]